MLICRVCLEYSDKLISLSSEDSIDSLPILHMISDFTIKNTEERLPKYICETCARHLDIAYEFKRKYEDSTVTFLRQTLYPAVNEDVNTTSEENSIDSKLKLHYVQQEEQQEPSQIRISSVYQLYVLPNDPKERLQHVESEMMETLNSDNANNQDLVIPNGSQSNDLNQHINKPQSELLNVLSDIDEQTEPNSVFNLQNVESCAMHLCNNESAVIQAMGSGFLSHENQIQPTAKELLNGDQFSNSYVITDIDSQSNGKDKLPKVEVVQFANDIPGKFANGTEVDQYDQPSADRETDSNCKQRVLRSNKIDFYSIDDNKLPKKVLDRIYINHHRGIRNFQCDVCFRWFKTKGHVKTHRLLHSQTIRNIKCGKCYLTFLTRTHLRKHKCLYD